MTETPEPQRPPQAAAAGTPVDDVTDLDVEWPCPGEVLYVQDGAYWIGVPLNRPEEEQKYILSRPAGPRSWSRPWAVHPSRSRGGPPAA